MTTATTQAGTPARAWWREPTMWLVVGGPLAVVLASSVTAVIAVRRADPVVLAAPALPAGLRPAVQARNHAAAPLPGPQERSAR